MKSVFKLAHENGATVSAAPSEAFGRGSSARLRLRPGWCLALGLTLMSAACGGRMASQPAGDGAAPGDVVAAPDTTADTATDTTADPVPFLSIAPCARVADY